MEDAKKHKWSCRRFVVPFFGYDRRLRTKWKISGVTDAGELIYVSSSFLGSFYGLYFDPKRDSLKRVKFKGTADDEFRFSNGLGSKRLHGPNHIESLISL